MSEGEFCTLSFKLQHYPTPGKFSTSKGFKWFKGLSILSRDVHGLYTHLSCCNQSLVFGGHLHDIGRHTRVTAPLGYVLCIRSDIVQIGFLLKDLLVQGLGTRGKFTSKYRSKCIQVVLCVVIFIIYIKKKYHDFLHQ